MNKNILKALFISILITIVYVFFVAPSNSFAKARLLSQDLINKLIYKISPTPKEANEIIIISIDRESLKMLNQKWPWPRSVFADCISKLSNYNPKAIYLDFAFIGESEDQANDDIFAEALNKAGNVLLPFYFDEKGNPLFPLQKFIENSNGFGPVNKLRDIDLSIRDTPLVYFSLEHKIIDYSIELILACKYYGISLGDILFEKNKIIIDPKGIKKDIPINQDGMFHINYLASLDKIKTIPFWKIIKEDLPSDFLKNKIVLVGLTDKTFIDTYSTPIGIASGTEIIANSLLTILSGKFIDYGPKNVDLSIILFMSLLIALTVFIFPPLKSFFATILELFIYFTISIMLGWLGYITEIFSVFALGIIIYIVIKIYKFICILEEQNVSLQKALKELKEAEAELVESEKLAAMGRLSAQLSHEINNPLCAIQTSINTIKYIVTNNEKIEKIKDITDRISGELTRLTKLSKDILGFVRPTKEEARPVNINNIIDDAISFYKNQFEQRKIEIELDMEKHLPNVTISTDKIKQVFSNLILNAQDAMPTGGKLNIKTKKHSNDDIEILFTDTGCGIPHEIINKIFESFFTTKKDGKGTGLGLFTARNIIRTYGGSIQVESNTKSGTIFKIRLPITK
jgi:signal transduction histidine kinase